MDKTSQSTPNGGDGTLDLTLKFDSQEVSEALGPGLAGGGTVPWLITVNLKDGVRPALLLGSDCVQVLSIGR